MISYFYPSKSAIKRHVFTSALMFCLMFCLIFCLSFSNVLLASNNTQPLSHHSQDASKIGKIGTIRKIKKIEIFSLLTQPIQVTAQHLSQVGNKPIEICYLDQYQRDLTQLNQTVQQQINQKRQEGMDDNTKQAILSGKLFADQYQAQFKTIDQSYRCRYDAKLLGITQVPAIIFIITGHPQKQYVVYGETDLQAAIDHYQSWLKDHAASNSTLEDSHES